MALGECVFTFVSDFSVVAHPSIEAGSLKQLIKPGQNRDGPNRAIFFSTALRLPSRNIDQPHRAKAQAQASLRALPKLPKPGLHLEQHLFKKCLLESAGHH